ncbi:hypothetical protein FGO68_gene15739 [Halteria grandinella]|uniref:Uncharacterized protein n=1 Tax=Halteria grandinella TaxID=5974 RepID=A0A8J8N9B9_HALGN|nr:hypothetical protein FGO68_gene15739 [Halteria grandinella]
MCLQLARAGQNFAVQTMLYTILNCNHNSFIHLVASYDSFTGLTETALFYLITHALTPIPSSRSRKTVQMRAISLRTAVSRPWLSN